MGLLVLMGQRKLSPLSSNLISKLMAASLCSIFMSVLAFGMFFEILSETHSKMPGAQHAGLWCLRFSELLGPITKNPTAFKDDLMLR